MPFLPLVAWDYIDWRASTKRPLLTYHPAGYPTLEDQQQALNVCFSSVMWLGYDGPSNKLSLFGHRKVLTKTLFLFLEK